MKVLRQLGSLVFVLGLFISIFAGLPWYMISEAAVLDADAVINVRYMTTSVVGSAAELLAYGTAVKLDRSGLN